VILFTWIEAGFSESILCLWYSFLHHWSGFELHSAILYNSNATQIGAIRRHHLKKTSLAFLKLLFPVV